MLEAEPILHCEAQCQNILLCFSRHLSLRYTGFV